MKGEAESINNFKFLIELSITQFSEFFNLRLLKNSLALAANSRSLNYEKENALATARMLEQIEREFGLREGGERLVRSLCGCSSRSSYPRVSLPTKLDPIGPTDVA